MNESTNCAEVIDKMYTRLAIGLLVAAVAYFLKATVFLTGPATDNTLEKISFWAGVLTILVVLTGMIPVMWRKLSSKSWTLEEPESYIQDAFKEALKRSWMITFVTLVILKSMDRMMQAWALPAEFYLQAMISLMMLTASVSFLWLSRETHQEQD